ncbi:MAG: winged helix-turn-helix domain-containing protein, partial [Methanohalobium sp.]|uniref:winged helix-turn-helix domain-containing protein n=1 Tax=Methanohalobium sp. TaxID=2837493 RepID=UPI00397A3B02
MNATNRTALFATSNGFIAINGAVKLHIMDLLDKRPCSFDEIVQNTGKAKSTVSVHLNDLKKANLLRESVDAVDR